MTSHIHNLLADTVAFTETNTPGFTEDNPATPEQMEAHAETMNTRAAELGIKTRYEVRD